MHTRVENCKLIIISANADETRAIGRVLGTAARADQCIALDGDLGVGKTELVRGIALGAGVADAALVSSPTYVLLNVYMAGHRADAKTVFHLDAYRIADASGFEAVGWDDLFGQGAIIVVEWAQRVSSLLPHDTLFVAGELLEGSRRRWTLWSGSKVSAALLIAVRRGLEQYSPDISS